MGRQFFYINIWSSYVGILSCLSYCGSSDGNRLFGYVSGRYYCAIVNFFFDSG